ncbi:MAG: hypothetical protein FWF46_07575 [Oscillospiraceae bacterium]|nr:hypothetical protein [Oscillospiraceae bacterium]
MASKIFGIIILVVLILFLFVAFVLKFAPDTTEKQAQEQNQTQQQPPKQTVDVSKLPIVYGAVGDGIENFLSDDQFKGILNTTYKINAVYDTWNNDKLVTDEVKRKNGAHYDFIFFSDQRFYDYYKLAPDKSKLEATRDKVIKSSFTLNTPIVIYSWDTVVDALVKQKIVKETDGVYYITDMQKLLNYILQGKTWDSIGVKDIYGKINIDSTDPLTSYEGASYYGLIASIMTGGTVTDKNISAVLPKLEEFYTKSGYMSNTQDDLFEMYLKTGMSSEPMIVGNENSIIDFVNSNPSGFAQVKDKIRILYPTPTTWDSHCIAALTDNGSKYLDVFNNAGVQQIAWSKYGFRTSITGGDYDASKLGVSGIPTEIKSVVSGLKMSTYDKMINYLK